MGQAVAVILASGNGERLKSELPKPLHRVCGRALLEYVLDAAGGVASERIVVLTPAEDSAFSPLVGERAACVAGAATLAAGVAAAVAQLPEGDPVLLLPADLPQLQASDLQALLIRHQDGSAQATRLAIGGMPAPVYALRREVAADLADGADLDTLFPEAQLCELDGEPLVDVNTRRDLARAEKAMRRAIAERLMDEGVTILDPENTYLDAAVKIGRDTILYPGSIIEGETEIGCRCVIGPQAHLIHCIVDDEVQIESSLMRDSRLRRGVRVGPFANIRPGCDVGEGSKVGDFVEMKNARIGERVSIAHLAYVGDAEVGERVNIGAGVITCNYDGVRKHRTTIGAHAFIGSNSVLIAPVTIGAGAYVAANSGISQDVPEDALGIARARQENKLEWARRRREAQRKE